MFVSLSCRLNRLAAAAVLAMPLAAAAAPTAINVDGLFNLDANVNIFNSTTVAHATVQGVLAPEPNAVNWYSFTGRAGATVFIDHDGGDLDDSTLGLFRSNGQLIASGDDSRPSDPGSPPGFNAFLGSYTLDADDTYYVGLAGSRNAPITSGCVLNTSLFRPDGGQGGSAWSDCTRRDFAYAGGSSNSGSYTLHISNSLPGGQVPEPATLALAGLALLAAGAARRRR